MSTSTGRSRRRRPLRPASAVFALLLMVSPGAAVAAAREAGHWYVGVGAGSAQVEGRCDAVVAIAGLTGCEHDAATLSGHIFVGYRFTDWFAVEAGYADLGTFRERDAGRSSRDERVRSLLPAGVSYEASEQVKIIGTVLNFVFSLPLSPRWAATANVGYFEWDQDFRAVVRTADGTFVRHLDQSGPDTTAGLALDFHPWNRWSFRFGWSYYAVDGDHHDVYGFDVLRWF